MSTESHLTVSGSLGPLLIGLILASCLYGVTSVQTYIYFIRGSLGDKKYLKSLVFFLWVLNTLRIVVLSSGAYTYMVTDFMDPLALSKPTWAFLPTSAVIMAISNGAVRIVFCYRIWRFSGHNFWLALLIALPVLTTTGTTLAYSVVAHRLPSWTSLAEYAWLLSWAFACSITADILICASVCVLLARRRTGYAATDTIVRKLIMYAVSTGLLSSICALLCLITYLTMPDNLDFMALYIVYPELVLNSLLATLNGRTSLQKNVQSSSTAQHGTLGSSQIRRCVHPKGQLRAPQANDINIVELGVLNSSTTMQGSDICVVEQGDEAHKKTESLHSWAS
ncbi:uncharacterized protein TRAVEDRAFT_42251 [Trametes versicolor FP-101664 SS1]|uniref:uncharacterized protein n=1 Tax=Trametes versicolor (strain FP-101664) TaxID=717944 RepID=UPI00046212CC|nr:uncharacterized protein TRAVEDRAFT_42251 [Trametes versicolor FP-101664 SS1]EIW64838.1 hypothetical protein TRAVEDRAFT_42251 [Trametes versicolor FP-101664 SS1]